MSSLIPPIGSHLPIVQLIIRAAVPIAVDYIVTRFLQAPRAAPALGTLAWANRNVTTLEQVADSLLYFAYKALHCFFSRAENKTTRRVLLTDTDLENVFLRVHDFLEVPSPTTDTISQVSNFENLQKQFKDFLPAITVSCFRVHPSNIRKGWGDRSVIERATAIFEMAAKDSHDLYDDLALATMDTKGKDQRDKKMAKLLMDKSQPYYERLCDPSKPSILFLYHFAREYGYYIRVRDRHYPHSLSLEKSDIQPFYQDNTAPSNWRSIYNEQVALWVNVLKHLPANSVVRQWTVKDTPEAPLPSVSFPDNFLIG